MFRLFKLAAYALLGYALYEFFLGFTGDGQSAQSAKRSTGRSRPEEGGEHGKFMTGASQEGASVQTESADGGRASQVVGRGVVR